MKTCAVINCESTNLVYSGVDAFVLGGIPTEKYCYQCASAYLIISHELESLVKN
jgi:hypothetical protein